MLAEGAENPPVHSSKILGARRRGVFVVGAEPYDAGGALIGGAFGGAGIP